MSPIGGYLELELNCYGEYFQDAIRLNSGRNALEYIIRARNIQHIFIPYYICHSVIEPIDKVGISRTFYHIDKNLDPIFNDRLKKDEALLFVNYFGLKQRAAELLTKKHKNLIIDNAQAFYCRPLPGKDTFYSPRKFFGIPDGAYLITDKFLELQLEQDVSIDRINHLIKRIEYGPEHGYADYVKNEALLSGQPIKEMSNITKAILNGIDYKRVREKREKNFRFVLGRR